MKKIKNKFWTFFFAIIPGCGHMYLGYMKRGVQFMTMFAAFAFLGGFTMVGPFGSSTNGIIGVFFLIFLPVIWFYQMFDSMHTVSQMRRLEIEFPEDDGFFIPGVSNISNISNLDSLNFFKKPQVVKAIAVILICVGGYVLFANMSESIYGLVYASAKSTRIKNMYAETYNTIMRYTPSVVISLVLIFAGIKLLKGNQKKQHNKYPDYNEYNADKYISEISEITEITDITKTTKTNDKENNGGE